MPRGEWWVIGQHLHIKFLVYMLISSPTVWIPFYSFLHMQGAPGPSPDCPMEEHEAWTSSTRIFFKVNNQFASDSETLHLLSGK